MKTWLNLGVWGQCQNVDVGGDYISVLRFSVWRTGGFRSDRNPWSETYSFDLRLISKFASWFSSLGFVWESFVIFFPFSFPFSSFLFLNLQTACYPRNSDLIRLGCIPLYFKTSQLILLYSHCWKPVALTTWILVIAVESQTLSQTYWIRISILIRSQVICMHSIIGETLSIVKSIWQWPRISWDCISQSMIPLPVHHLGICLKCTFLSTTLNLPKGTLWGWGQQSLVL